MLLPHIIARPSPSHGLGLFATEPIPAGTVVWHPCLRCPVFPAAVLHDLGASQFRQLDEYGYFLDDGSVILPCSLAFLLNHSCDANVLDYGLDFGIAVRDVAAGEEVTLDYRTFASDPPWEVACACGSPDCARVIGPAHARPAAVEEKWSARVTRALASLHHVDQPLHASLEACSRAYAAARTSNFRPDPAHHTIRRQPSPTP